jgi:hypothetical protein
MYNLTAYQEVTDWGDNTPNHTYVLNDNGWLVAYIKQGTTELITLNNPMKQFSKSKRKFKKVTI